MFDFAYIFVPFFKLIELCLDLQLNAVQSVNLFSYNRLFEKRGLFYELVNWLSSVPVIDDIVCDHLNSVRLKLSESLVLTLLEPLLVFRDI